MNRHIYATTVFVFIAFTAVSIVSASVSVENIQPIESDQPPLPCLHQIQESDVAANINYICGDVVNYGAGDRLFDIDKYGYTNAFKQRIRGTKPVIKKDGYYYHSGAFDFVWSFDSYFSIKCDYLLEHPNSQVIINLEGHGLFNNNEIVARSYDNRIVYDDKGIAIDYPGEYLIDSSEDWKRSVYIEEKTIDYLYGDIKYLNLKWYGTWTPNGGWTDVVWGQMYMPNQQNTK